MDEWLSKLLTMVFWLGIAVAIGLALWHFLPNTATNWIETQINAIFGFGSNIINNSMQ